MSTPEPPARRRPPARRAALGLISLTFLTLLVTTWGTWVEAFVDFGRELYIPWQLARGEVLYRDVAHFNGPLSQYVNAGVFAVFGVGLRSLVVANLVWLVVATVVVHRVLAFLSAEWVATVGVLAFLVVFAFPTYPIAANYNWVAPYSHEITHGPALALGALYALTRYARRRRAAALGAAGVLVGLTFLTKAEVFLAASAVVVGAVLLLAGDRRRGRPVAARAGVFFAGLVLPAAAAVGLLSLAMPVGEAFRGVLGSWKWVGEARLHDMPFYRRVFGTVGFRAYSPGVMLALWSGYLVVGLGTAVAAAYAVGRFVRRHHLEPSGRALLCIGVGAFCVAFGVTYPWRRDVPWEAIVHTFPILVLAAAVTQLVLAVRDSRSGRTASDPIPARAPLAMVFCGFAFLLLLKILFNVTIFFYGFALAAPATLVVVVLLLHWAPGWLARAGGPAAGVVFAGVGAAAVATFAWHAVETALRPRREEMVAMAGGADRFLADAQQARPINALLAEIERTVPKDATLVVIPEGAMINYLSRRANPTPYVTFLPPEMVMFGEGAMVAALRARPPDYVVQVQRDTREYGTRLIGRKGYGEALMGWVAENYTPVWRTGAPMGALHFGVVLYQRAGAEGAAAGR